MNRHLLLGLLLSTFVSCNWQAQEAQVRVLVPDPWDEDTLAQSKQEPVEDIATADPGTDTSQLDQEMEASPSRSGEAQQATAPRSEEKTDASASAGRAQRKPKEISEKRRDLQNHSKSGTASANNAEQQLQSKKGVDADNAKLEPKTKKPEENKDQLIVRQGLAKEWKALLSQANEKTLSRRDLNTYIPLAQGVETYIAYGSIKEATTRLTEIQQQLNTVNLKEVYIQEKVKESMAHMTKIDLSSDQISEMQDRITQTQSLLKSGQLEAANENINLVLRDLLETKNINDALKN